MIEIYPPQELDDIANRILTGPYRHDEHEQPGRNTYPAHRNRLFIDTPDLQRMDARTLFVPDGPWHIENHANRQGIAGIDPEVPLEHAYMPLEITERLKRTGHTMFDQYGRPIHPGYRQLLSDERIGMPTGLGFFWQYGENHTVDPVVYRRSKQESDPEFLLIKRKRGGGWALPGGFRDSTDQTTAACARRELKEETGLEPEGMDEEIFNKRPVGKRDTLFAWTRNTVVLIHADNDYLHDVKPEARDDAIDSGWFTKTDMHEKLDMFEAHSQYIGIAITHLTR